MKLVEVTERVEAGKADLKKKDKRIEELRRELADLNGEKVAKPAAQVKSVKS